MSTVPFFPIVYLRGYAGSQAAVEETVATPFMGFNLGSTKIRQLWTGDIDRYIFESPLVRLMKDHGYQDVYEDGAELRLEEKSPSKSIWIYRYYEPVSKELGAGFRPEIEDYARGLHGFIERIRDQVCGPADAGDPDVHTARADFKLYLVAHSMGGLIIRCYLQKIAPELDVSPPVDKVFTYGTPHGGIDFRLIGNVPAFVQMNNMENFNIDRMREYLNLPDGPINSLGGAFDPDRFFCLMGTNHRDYEAGHGLSSAAVGPMSDGLVQLKNAYVEGAPRAFVHRAHSGAYGLVNSEEGYQNLRRFLFGQVRVDALLTIGEITLPSEIQKALDEGQEVRASYHIETIVRVRGVRWDLHRRTAGEESAIFATYDSLKDGKPIFLMSGYLLRSARVAHERQTLGFSIDLGILVPDYTVNRAWRPDDHYEGGYIYRDKINLDLATEPEQEPVLRFGFDSRTPNRATQPAVATRLIDGQYEFRVPIKSPSRPGLQGELLFKAQPWN